MAKKELVRCEWPLKGNELYLRYHDEEWGVPVWDDEKQFEFLVLEGAQAGLSWATILNRREGYRKAFADFDAKKVAKFGKKDVERLMKDAGIIRNRLKIESTISNAKLFLDYQEKKGSFADFLWSFVEGQPIQNNRLLTSEVPATSPESDVLSKALKKMGFRFVGSTIIYAHMQATGMVNDHLTSCYRHRECVDLAKKK
jgi:DNA-3-methyladenine glycosylase I